jgi:hypothetical protein
MVNTCWFGSKKRFWENIFVNDDVMILLCSLNPTVDWLDWLIGRDSVVSTTNIALD